MQHQGIKEMGKKIKQSTDMADEMLLTKTEILK